MVTRNQIYRFVEDNFSSFQWHDAQDLPYAKQIIIAKMDDGQYRSDYAINMVLFWGKVSKWIDANIVKQKMNN